MMKMYSEFGIPFYKSPKSKATTIEACVTAAGM
jgi:hypothetical protein